MSYCTKMCFCAAWIALSLCVRAERLSFLRSDATVAYNTAKWLVKDCTPRNAGTPGAIAAAEWLRARAGDAAKLDRFRDNVYDDVCDFANVVLELRGNNPDAPWIVLMSHFDTAPNVAEGFEGANDGASTSGILVALAGVIRRSPKLSCNVLLAWTDAEECRVAYGPRDGFQGSKRLVEYVREKGHAVKAAVCVDMTGDRDLNIEIPQNGAKWLRRLAIEAAGRAGVSDKVMLKDSVTVKDDHCAFLDAGLPAIDLIDFDYGSAPGKNDYWHTPQDTVDKISEESLFASGALVAELINLLTDYTP